MPWVLTIHLFGVIFWLGSLLMITSLLALVPDEVGVAKERFIVAARRLMLSGHIGAAIAIVFGILLIPFQPEALREGWLHLKILLVIGLIIVHVRIYRRIVAMESAPASAESGGEFMMLHGIVSALLLAILILALLKPFSG